MAESVVDATSYENKMDKSVASYGRLEVSVSFGKFDNDSLSWEKFSTFSPNKYLEEVEKCATPGSVAKKKAYFEAHYKKIAARKADQLDQEKHEETTPQKAGDEVCEDSVVNDGEFGYAFNCKSSVEGEAQENDVLNGEFGYASNCKSSAEGGSRENDVLNDLSTIHVENSDGELPITSICENLPVKEARIQVNITDGGLTEDRPVLVEEEEEEKEISSKEPQETKQVLHIRKNEIIDAVDNKKEKQKLARAKESKKVTPLSKDRNVVNKKPVSPITKLPHITAPKVSKPAGNTSSILASRSSTKRIIGVSPPKSRISRTGQSKRDVSKSLHMSFSIGPSNSDQASFSSTRRSSIMEQMGDKDIVKRAFKSFQKSFSQSKTSSEDISSAPKQMSTRGKQPKVYAPMTPQKGSLKSVSRDKKNPKAAPVPYGLNSDEHDEKQKKPIKKLDSNSLDKEAERACIQVKPKGDNYSDIRKSRQNLSIKALPVSGLHRGHKLSKRSLNEGNSNNKIH